MKCPNCADEVLIAVEYDEVEIDYCPVCKGVWLDSGEIEILFGDADAAAAFLTIGSPAQVPPGEKYRDCPECDAKMDKETTEGAQPVTFDHCPNGDGIWFDDRELATVLEHKEALAGNSEVSSLLQGIFHTPND